MDVLGQTYSKNTLVSLEMTETNAICNTPTALYCALVLQDNVGLSKSKPVKLNKEWQSFTEP